MAHEQHTHTDNIHMFVDIMFIADILINFRTTYVHNGEVVREPILRVRPSVPSIDSQ